MRSSKARQEAVSKDEFIGAIPSLVSHRITTQETVYLPPGSKLHVEPAEDVRKRKTQLHPGQIDPEAHARSARKGNKPVVEIGVV